MKKILAPTDFSAAAENAVDYAAKLAESMNVTLILLNCYHLPLMASGEGSVSFLTLETLEKESKTSLLNEKKRIHRNCPKVKIETESVLGFAVEGITDFANKNSADLIVMGISSAGKFSELVMGSISTEVVKETSCPVLIVPEKVRYQNLMKITLACDLKDIVHPECFDSLKELVSHFKAGLNVLNIIKPDEEISIEKAVNGIRLEHLFEDLNHTLHFEEEQDVVEGIENFVEQNKVNMVSIVSRKHNFINRLLHESNTKRMAFHTHVPLLALHE